LLTFSFRLFKLKGDLYFRMMMAEKAMIGGAAAAAVVMRVIGG
jgi:hypothetical protein